MDIRTRGIDPSSNWKVVTYEGKIVTFVDDKGKRSRLVGFNGYRTAAAAAAKHGGVAVRE